MCPERGAKSGRAVGEIANCLAACLEKALALGERRRDLSTAAATGRLPHELKLPVIRAAASAAELCGNRPAMQMGSPQVLPVPATGFSLLIPSSDLWIRCFALTLHLLWAAASGSCRLKTLKWLVGPAGFEPATTPL